VLVVGVVLVVTVVEDIVVPVFADEVDVAK